MKTKLFITMALFAIIVLAVIGCKHDDPPAVTPVPPNEVSVGGFKVTINNYNLLSAEKLALLKEVIPEVLAGKTLTGNLTINVIADGTDNFTPDGAKTLKVGATWMSTATKSAMGSSINAFVSDWIALYTQSRALVRVTNIC
jgi:hypothetical protein